MAWPVACWQHRCLGCSVSPRQTQNQEREALDLFHKEPEDRGQFGLIVLDILDSSGARDALMAGACGEVSGVNAGLWRSGMKQLS